MAKKSQNQQKERLFEEHLVPAAPGSGRLFDVGYGDEESKPVDCLGMTFPNDEARRAYFTEKLREKLKDLAFLAIEGFPIGEDEDILALSDPPYYTACPNPFIAELVRHFGSESCVEQDGYQQKPFGADVSEGRMDSIYTAHSYHTKVPPVAIAAYVLHHTKPGDTVLDIFSGSGMTGVGCTLCSSAEIAEKYAGVLGLRNAVLCDLAPAATFIASVYMNAPPDDDYSLAASRLMADADKAIGDLWSLDRDGIKHRIDFQVWMEVFYCPNCQREVLTDRHAGATKTIGVSNVFPCPNCGCSLSKAPLKGGTASRLERRLSIKFDPALRTTVSFVPRKPTVAYLSSGKTRRPVNLTPEEQTIVMSMEPSPRYWYPTNVAVTGEEFLIKHCLHSFGVTHVHHLYLPRQLSTYSCLWHLATTEPNYTLRSSLMFTLSSNAVGMTLLNRFSETHFSQVNQHLSGTLYLPSAHAETSYKYCYGGKIKRLEKAFNQLNRAQSRNYAITTQSSTSLSNIPDSSIDYVFTDPPFGRNIPYSELNQVWEAWLRVFSDRGPEAIIDQTLKKDVLAYGGLMRRAFAEVYRVLKPGRCVTVVFHNSHNAVWFAIQEALLAGGLVVADVRTLDRQRETYKQSRQGIVKQDLVISAYKPSEQLERELRLHPGEVDTVWIFISHHLRQLPVSISRNGTVEVIAERQDYLLYDRMIAFHVQREVSVPLSAAEFRAGLKEKYPERDGMYFLPDQVSEYDRNKLEANEVEQLSLFVSDEKSAIQWVRTRLADKFTSYQDLQPLYMQEAQRVWEKYEHPLELRTILEQNFVEESGGKWRVPDPKKEADLEQLRHRALMKEFQQYLETKNKLKVVRTEALRAGFKESWQKKDYTTIVQMAKRLPEAVIQEDPALLMYFDNASLMLGERTLRMANPERMTLAELQKFIAASKGEWEQTEFKKTTGELQGGMETLCGFLNGSGGKVLFGVTNAGKIVGEDMSDPTFQEVANALRKLEPHGWIEQTRIPAGGTREVLLLETTVHADAPYTFDGRPYQRIGNTTSRMPQAEYQRRLLARASTRRRWENQVAEGYSGSDLDVEEIDRAMRAAIHCGRLESQASDPLDALDRLQLRVEGQLLNAAVVLFGRKFMPYYPQCTVRLARFKGTDKSEFFDQRQLHGHAFQILDESMHFILRNIPIAGHFEPGKLERQDVPLYPPLALREALVNALCHRDYTIAGGAIFVAIYDDRLEVTSTGLLPPGITIAELKRDHGSRLRNPLIAGVFYRRGLIEQWGRGTQRIVDWCVAAGQPEPEFEERAGAVVVRFRPSGYHPPLRVSQALSERQRQILLILSQGGDWTFGKIYERLNDPPARRTIQADLRFLRDLNLVDFSGHGGSARWRLKMESQ